MALNGLKTKRVQDGKALDYLASADVVSGDPVLLGDGRAAIAVCDTAAGSYGAAEVQTGVVYRGVKGSGALSKGTALWWDATNKVYGASGTFRVGLVLEDAETSDAEVIFSLNAHLLGGAVKIAHLESTATTAQIVAALQASGLMAAS